LHIKVLDLSRVLAAPWTGQKHRKGKIYKTLRYLCAFAVDFL
jgi:hypothetical protein